MAAAEVVRAAAWYENEAAGLGDRFVDAVEATVLRGSRWPNVGKPVVITPDGAVVNRTLPVGGFPWAIATRSPTRSCSCSQSSPPRHREPEYWIDRTSE